MPTLEVQTVAF